jgi:hypothetical protein
MTKNTITLLVVVSAFALLASCGGTTIKPASTTVTRTTTTQNPQGRPVTETVSGTATGPSISSTDPKALEMETVTPTLTLPGSGDDTLSAGEGRSSLSGSFGRKGSLWGMYLVGLGLIGGGVFVALRLLKVTLGVMMVGCGAFVIAATIYPLLWLGAAACALGYVAWTIIEARKQNQAESGLLAAVKAINGEAKPVTTTDGQTFMVNAVAAKVKEIASPAANAAIKAVRGRIAP